MDNFKCPKTGEQFSISAYKSKVVEGKVRYYQSGPGWIELIGPAGVPLEKIFLAEVPKLAIKTGDGSKI